MRRRKIGDSPGIAGDGIAGAGIAGAGKRGVAAPASGAIVAPDSIPPYSAPIRIAHPSRKVRGQDFFSTELRKDWRMVWEFPSGLTTISNPTSTLERKRGIMSSRATEALSPRRILPLVSR